MASSSKTQRLEIAYFGAGCFWHVQADFDMLPGVVETTVGYSGGKTKNPTYAQVCTNLTGHVEICRVTYDPKKVTYKRLLQAFWKMHDPTQHNRQGFDIGTQYRSVIFYTNAAQKKDAEASLKEVQKKFDKPIATAIEPASEFYAAEEYHQKYNAKHGIKGKVC